MERKFKVYEIEYASNLFTNRKLQTTNIYSDTQLNKDDFVVVEHIGYGIFIGKILTEKDFEDWTNDEIKDEIEYKYIQHIDLSNFLGNIEKQKRKEELKKEMEKKFSEIDKERKFEFYASLDSDFKSMYEEYKNL